MSKKPRTLVLFFMVGCPHCAANQKAWDEAKKQAKGKMEIEEHEAGDEATASEGVNSFPTMKLKDGETEAVLEGAQSSGKEIVKKLEAQLPKESSKRKRGRRSTRRLTHRGGRKLRRGTLRNYVGLR